MAGIPINQDNLLALVQNLIRINSVNPSLSANGKGEGEIALYIGDYLNRLGLKVHYQEIDKNRLNVIAVLKGSGNGPSLMLNGHTDTAGIDNMEIDPLTPEYRDGKIFGRGALDMKGGLAAQIIAIQSIIESGRVPKGDVILTCIVDEEYESIGTREMLKTFSADAAIICESTNLHIIIAHKGFAWAKIEVFGQAAHGSLPDKGIDAIAKAGKVLTGIETLSGTYLLQEPHLLLGVPSIHASSIHGGIGLSTYPDYCKIELERRTLPHEDQTIIENELGQLLNDIHLQDDRFQAKADVFLYRPAFEISPDQPIIQALSRGYQTIHNKDPKLKGMGAWLESALLAQAGIPSVIFGPYGKGAHAAVEFVDFDSLVTTTEILIETILDFCNER